MYLKSSIKIPKQLLNIDKTVLKAVKEGVEDCTDDLLRVASLRAPVNSTTLEKNGTSEVETSGDKIVGRVSFQAINKGYNYAYKMDRGNYKLGKESLAKSKRGVRSKFTNESLKVGSGYLTDTAEKCEKGYINYINYKIYEVIAEDGFNVTKKGK